MSNDDPEFVPIKDEHGRIRGLMDQATAEYMNSTAPNPDPEVFDAMLSKVTRIRVTNAVLERDQKEPTLLFETDNRKEIEALRKCLALAADPAGGHCMSPGFPLLEFYDEHRHLATIAFLHGAAIRWDVWKDDAMLADGKQALHWLAKNGVEQPLKEYIADEERRRQRVAEKNAWMAAVPSCLVPLGESVLDDSNVTPLRSALSSAYPTIDERIRVLLVWLSAGSGKYSGYPCYEQAPMNLLLEFTTEELVNAVEKAPSERVLAAARRLFTCWLFKQRKDKDQVPDSLK